MTPTLSQGQAEPTELLERVKLTTWTERENYGDDFVDAFNAGVRACIEALAASSAAPTADLRAAILNLPCCPTETAHWTRHGDAHDHMNQAYADGHRDARHAAAQLAAVPQDAKATVENMRPLLEGWKGESRPAAVAAPDAREAGGERSHLGNPAASQENPT